LEQELRLDHLHPTPRFEELIEFVNEGGPSRRIKTISEHTTIDEIERFRRQDGPLKGLIHVPSLLFELHDASLLFFILLVAGCASSSENVNTGHLYEAIVSMAESSGPSIASILRRHMLWVKEVVAHQNFLAIVSSKQVIDPGPFAESTI
jgi:hypothetical protein